MPRGSAHRGIINVECLYIIDLCFIDAETDFSVVKDHIKQQGSVDVLSLKSYLIGPSRVGKTTTRKRLTGELKYKLSPNENVPSTDIEAPLMVQLYRADADTESTALLWNLSADAWQSQQKARDQFQTFYSYISLNTKVPTTPTATGTQDEDVDGEAMAVTELIKENDWEYIKENTSLKDLDSLTFINFIDVGGQPEFHELLPLLLHQGPALNLFFLNMCQTLDYKYDVTYEDQNGDSPIQYKCEFSTKEIIQRALQSILSIQPKIDRNEPAAILIGTHNDKTPRADLEQSVQDTFSSFIENGVLCPVSKPGEEPKRYVHPISNVCEEGSDEESNSDIEDLREVIIKTIFRNQKADKFLSRNHFKPEEVPTATFFLYLKLRKKFDPNPGWCWLQECIDIAATFRISKEDLTKEGGILQYLHEKFGIILHYRDLKLGLQLRVIVNLNIIVRPPVELLMTAFGTETSKHAMAERLHRTGEIPHDLMEKVCSLKSTENEIPTAEIVELLESRHILYKSGGDYFMPCLLRPDNNIEEQSQDPNHLKGLTYSPILLIPRKGYVPLGLFAVTVIKLSQSNRWRLVGKQQFRNRIRFLFHHSMEGVMYYVELRALSTHLEFRIHHEAFSKPINSRLIPECRRELKSVFDEASSRYYMQWDFGFYCPYAIQSGRCPHPARHETTRNKTRHFVICGKCKNDDYDQTVNLEEKHKCWFTVS